MPSSGSERQRKAGPCARRYARVPSVEPPSMTRNSYSPFRCERTEATVAAIFAPLLKVGVITDISGGFMTNAEHGGDSIWGEATGRRTAGLKTEANPVISSANVAKR